MSEGESDGQKYVLEGAVVYIHVVPPRPGASESLVHIDVEHPELNDIIVAKESSYVGGKQGGFFVGLRPAQAKRAEEFLQGRV